MVVIFFLTKAYNEIFYFQSLLNTNAGDARVRDGIIGILNMIGALLSVQGNR